MEASTSKTKEILFKFAKKERHRRHCLCVHLLRQCLRLLLLPLLLLFHFHFLLDNARPPPPPSFSTPSPEFIVHKSMTHLCHSRSGKVLLTTTNEEEEGGSGEGNFEICVSLCLHNNAKLPEHNELPPLSSFRILFRKLVLHKESILGESTLLRNTFSFPSFQYE
ncbi:unnamed protein product [Caenorhabditis nigoni]